MKRELNSHAWSLCVNVYIYAVYVVLVVLIVSVVRFLLTMNLINPLPLLQCLCKNTFVGYRVTITLQQCCSVYVRTHLLIRFIVRRNLMTLLEQLKSHIQHKLYENMLHA